MFRGKSTKHKDAESLNALLEGQDEIRQQLKDISASLASTRQRAQSRPPTSPVPTGPVPHGFSKDNSPTKKKASIKIPSKFNIPGGVMISLNVRSQLSSANILAAALRKRGIDVWLCSELTAGSDFRDEIVMAVKNCRVFLPLINDAWGSSGECRDEFSLAKRKNLTSHESGRTDADKGELRLPGIVPIAFPDLVWDKYPHVELLAATTNFLLSNNETIDDGDETLIDTVLVSLLDYHVLEEGGKLDRKPSKKADAADINQKTSIDASESIRAFKAGCLPAKRFLGTTSYVEEEDNFHFKMTDEMDMTLEIFKGEEHDDMRARAHLVYSRLNTVVRYEGVIVDDLTAAEQRAPHLMAAFVGKYGEVYGEETLEGPYNPDTGVLDLSSVSTTGDAAPTWQHLTLCDNGRILVGVGGNLESGEMSFESLDSFRFVAF